jgi:hypothetical protein
MNFTIFVQYFARGFLNIYSYSSIGLLRKLQKNFFLNLIQNFV